MYTSGVCCGSFLLSVLSVRPSAFHTQARVKTTLHIVELFSQSDSPDSALLTTREAAWCIILVVSDVGSSSSHMWHMSTHCGSSSYTKVIESRSRSQEPKRSKIPIPAM